MAGEFRGFGGNQVTFALEGQIDRLADKLQMDPLEIRRKNLRKAKDPGPVGQRIAPTNGAGQVLEAIEPKRSKKKLMANDRKEKWKAYGTGIALTIHGGDLGVGRLDPAGGSLALTSDGKLEAAFGFEECGQGLLAVIETLLLEEFQCSAEDFRF